MKITTLFFDLDDTLYSPASGLWAAIRDRMGDYMAERLALPREDIPAMRRFYYQTYGTTLRGLQIHYQVEAEDYLAYVHDLPLDRYIQPNPELRQILLSLPQRCWIFTNADSDHARRVLSVLNLSECFCGMIDVRAMQFACKPEAVAYQRALALAGKPEPAECALLDDSYANLAAAAQMGFTTVLVHPEPPPGPGATVAIPSLLALPQAMPGLWNHLR